MRVRSGRGGASDDVCASGLPMMPAVQRHRTRRATKSRRLLGALLVAAAAGLAGCGGSGASHTTSHPATTALAAQTTQSSSASTSTTTSAAVKKKRHTDPPRTTTTTSTTSSAATVTTTVTTTSIAPTPVTPKYQGPSPEGCLTAAGLNRARAAREPGVWEANSGLSALTNREAIVFLSGPLKSPLVAKNYAQSLQVVEIAASGGDWVASAALPSHLTAQVAQVAACMAKSGATRSKS